MRDIQNETDTRKIPLQKVGVKGVRYPVTVLDKNHKQQQTTATVDLFVNLPHNFKGTHMSRFIEVFHKYHEDVTMQHFLDMLEEMRKKLDAAQAFGTVSFPCHCMCRTDGVLLCRLTVYRSTICIIGDSETGISHNRQCGNHRGNSQNGPEQCSTQFLPNLFHVIFPFFNIVV